MPLNTCSTREARKQRCMAFKPICISHPNLRREQFKFRRQSRPDCRASHLTVSARAALVMPYEPELLELLVRSSIDLSAGFPLSARLPPFSTFSMSNLWAIIHGGILFCEKQQDHAFYTGFKPRRYSRGIALRM